MTLATLSTRQLQSLERIRAGAISEMQFESFEPGIEVSGECIGAIVDGFRLHPGVALKYLTQFGIIKEGETTLALDPAAYYPLDAWLSAFKGVSEEVGVNALFNIGRRIPENAVFPPFVKDIRAAIKSIEIAYHMNHRKGGSVMFDSATGAKLEGIGHYGYEEQGDRTIVCLAANPYPCDFDRGLVTAMASRFEAFARTSHDPKAPCRKKGADSCTYIVTW